MAPGCRVFLLLFLWFAFGCEALAGSRTVAVQVTFVEIAQHSATQTVTFSEAELPGASSKPQISADLQQTRSGSKPLSLLVEGWGDPPDSSGANACVPSDPMGTACGRRVASDPIVTISYH